MDGKKKTWHKYKTHKGPKRQILNILATASDCDRVNVNLTSSELHVHQWVGDDGQDSVGEGVSALLPVNRLEEDKRKHVSTREREMATDFFFCIYSGKFLQ